jgi:glycerol-3-phosphate dehydrogenase
LSDYNCDVLIIGAGLVGTAVARELSKYSTNTIIIEKERDLCLGTCTKSAHGSIYYGLLMAVSLVLKSVMGFKGQLYKSDSLKARFCREGFSMWPQLLEELEIRYKKPGLLVIARDDEEKAALNTIEEILQSMGYSCQRLNKNEIKAIEPSISDDVVTCLYDTEHLISVFPTELIFAFADNAIGNGVRLLLDTRVLQITMENEAQIVETNRGTIKAKYIINAAGLYADKVAQMAGVDDWTLQFSWSQMLVMDKKLDGLVKHAIHLPPLPGVFDMIIPMYDGNVYLACSDYTPTEIRTVVPSIAEQYQSIISRANRIVPGISEEYIIKAFTGIRSWNTRDPEETIAEPSRKNPKFISVALRLPGLSQAPAVAKYIINLLKSQGLKLDIKNDFQPHRKAIPRPVELSAVECNRQISSNPEFGHVVCRCETVTEGEILEAIKRGNHTLDGIKFRTRAGMGTCQGNFCSSKIAGILKKEIGQTMDKTYHRE